MEYFVAFISVSFCVWLGLAYYKCKVALGPRGVDVPQREQQPETCPVSYAGHGFLGALGGLPDLLEEGTQLNLDDSRVPLPVSGPSLGLLRL
jgi:hypothetical protein